MTARPLRITVASGLPPDGARGQFIGRDADGCLWLLQWNGHCWSALGFHLNRPEPWPELLQLHGEHAGFILGWVQGPDPEFQAGRSGARDAQGAQP